MAAPNLGMIQIRGINVTEYQSELKGIFREMDEISKSILHTLQSILMERKYFEANLKEGYINMAKSRYLMSGRKIDIHQVNSSSLTSSFRVSSYLDVDDADQDVTFLNYHPVDDTEQEKNKNELKHRSVNSDDRHVEDVQQVCLSSGEEGNNETSDIKDNVSLGYVDPLKWFGILVPENLRTCQSHFKQSLITAVKITSLQNKLLTLSKKYMELKIRKRACKQKFDYF
ncbi:uncharacterized protein NPIL_390311 [Nephila pilipes]|uniref:Vacuolar ATPase assembly protein VMA22 n=1 Tax=Nephila pilipes TaxID=299642 RepID=A0A8X6NI46_NEPPI|nr:uncharacterized protein NPIL_390311 [Nephila pilipes]